MGGSLKFDLLLANCKIIKYDKPLKDIVKLKSKTFLLSLLRSLKVIKLKDKFCFFLKAIKNDLHEQIYFTIELLGFW